MNRYDPISLGLVVNSTLTKYIAVHDDLFGKSVWQALRRVLPIPGLSDAIPYAGHAETLHSLLLELGQIDQYAFEIVSSSPVRGTTERFLIVLRTYCGALATSITKLYEICRQCALTAQGMPGSSWADYKSSVDDYKSSCRYYVQLGGPLNEAFARMQDEAKHRL